MSFYNQNWDRPYLTPSIAKTLTNKSPLHAKLECRYFYPSTQKYKSAAMTEGSLVDSMLLGGKFDIDILDFDSFRTKAAREVRDECIADGKEFILKKDYDRCQELVECMRVGIKCHPLALQAIEKGVIQKRFFWHNVSDLSTEPDIYFPNESLVIDLKRTAIPPTEDRWKRHVASMDYDIQAAATLEATGAKNFAWLIVESQFPYCSVLHFASDHLLDVGAQRWYEAKTTWDYCIKNNDFYGYKSGVIDPMPYLMDYEENDINFDE